MSQQPTPPPQKPEPQTPGPKPDMGRSESALQQLSHKLQQAWTRTQPVLRSQSIKVLRATIQLLQSVLAKLEATPPKTPLTKVPEPAQSNATVESTESRATPVIPLDPAANQSSDPSMPSSLEGILDKLRPRLKQLQGWWSIALTKIRSWLPESINQKFSDTTLAAAIAGVLVFLLWFTSALLPGASPKIANAPTPQRDRSVPDLVAPPGLGKPDVPQPVGSNPSPPKPVPASSPTLAISPEEQRVMDIQAQITDVGNHYANCLIQLVQTNFQAGRLTARTSNTWYDLSPSQQDSLAAELLDQTQTLNFSQLKIVDIHGTLLARSPVVGNNMVILQREIAAPKLTAS